MNIMAALLNILMENGLIFLSVIGMGIVFILIGKKKD